MRSVLTRLVEREEDLVVCGEASSAEEALERVADLQPDLVLIDISLPGMSGINLIRELREQFPNLASLIVSGHKESIYGREVMRAGAYGYVEKANAHGIIDAIRHILQGGAYFGGERLSRTASEG